MKLYWDLVNNQILQGNRKPNSNCIRLSENLSLADGKYITVTPRDVVEEVVLNRPKILRDENDAPILDAEGNEQPVQATDEQGLLLFVLDQNGDQALDENGDPIPAQATEEYTVTTTRVEHDFTVDTAQKTADTAVKDKTAQVEAAHSGMNTDVYAAMAQVFGTTNPESATAYEATWRMMKDAPADYASLGITARFTLAGLTAGDALDTEQKVLDYANAKLQQVRDYSKSRMQRIEQFRTEREQILNS